MRALLCKTLGSPDSLVIENVPTPAIPPGHVLVSVMAAGVNFTDALIVQGNYQLKPQPPFSPGADISGIVRSVASDVTTFKPGDRVTAILSPSYGGLREEVSVSATRLVKIPDAIDFPVAAAFGLTYTTALHALKNRGNLHAGETLLVLGASGGVGLAAVNLGKLMGAFVIACASTQEKLDACRRAGADSTINYESEDLRKRIGELTGGKGVDVVCDPVGGKHSEAALRGIAQRGRYLVIGFAAGPIPQFALNLILLKCCCIIGIRRGEFMAQEPGESDANIRQLVEWIADGKIAPLVSRTYPFEQSIEAIKAVMSRNVIGKVVITM